MGRVGVSNVWYFIQGYVRYFLYYSRFRRLIPSSLRDQIGYRISVMRSSCYENGSCDECGCSCTALQMSNKSCDGLCYPPMMGESKWHRFKNFEEVEDRGVRWQLRYIGGEKRVIELLRDGIVVSSKELYGKVQE